MECVQRALPAVLCSCLYRWQLAKGDQLRDFDHCEVCHQPYRIPPGALQALFAQGHLPQQSARMRLWRCQKTEHQPGGQDKALLP